MLNWSLKRKTAPTAIFTVKEMFDHDRVEEVNEAAVADTYRATAERYVENVCSVAIKTQTWELWLYRFPPWEILLPRPPLVSVVAITYVDPDGAVQTFDSAEYVVETRGHGLSRTAPGHVRPIRTSEWPSTQYELGAARIEFTAGFGDTQATIPDEILHAIRLQFGDYFENRERSQVMEGIGLKGTGQFDDLIADYRVLWEPHY